MKGETCDFIVMSLCFSNSSRLSVICLSATVCSTVNCCMRVLQRHRIYNYLGDYGGLERSNMWALGQVGLELEQVMLRSKSKDSEAEDPALLPTHLQQLTLWVWWPFRSY